MGKLKTQAKNSKLKEKIQGSEFIFPCLASQVVLKKKAWFIGYRHHHRRKVALTYPPLF